MYMEKYVSDFLKTAADNIRCIITGNFTEGVTDLNTLGNHALLRIDRKSVTPSVKNLPKLTAEQKKQIKKFYSPYVMFMTTRYHRLYTANYGEFHPEFFPEEFYAMYIDRYYSDREEARYLDNKCYYYRIFSNVHMPELIAMRIGTTWLNADQEPITQQQASLLVIKEKEAVVKKAVNSEGGFGVSFVKGEELYNTFTDTMNSIGCDVVIQKPVKQHSSFAALHPDSVNTIRVVSLLRSDNVKIYAAALKIGTGGSRTDNGCQGGIYCGLNSDGSLKNYGILDNGTLLYEHPDLHYKFSEKKLCHLDRVFELVKKAHPFMGHFRLISWDVTVDENGDAVLIEANLSLGGINDVQMCCGPLFGEDTKAILDEALQGKRRFTTLI